MSVIVRHQFVELIHFARIYPEAMIVNVQKDISAIHISSVKNVTALNVNANHHINWLVEVAFFLDVKMGANVRLVLNAYQLLVELATVPVPKAIEHKPMVHVWMSTNV